MKIPEILQIETPHAPGALASVLSVLAERGLVLEHVSSVRRDQDRTLWEITVEIDIEAHAGLVERLNALPSARFIGCSDRVFDRHRGGKIEMHSRVAISTQQILRDIYTPGVARVCLAIQAAPEKVFDFTYLGRAVAIVTDGSAILGLGNIGPRAGLPVMEGKAALFAALVGISGIPILIESGAVDHFVDVVCSIAPSFGAILLEDISAPRCFEIEQKLRTLGCDWLLGTDLGAEAMRRRAQLARATDTAIELLRPERQLEEVVQGRRPSDGRCCHSLPVRLRILSSVVSTVPSSPTLVSSLSGRLRACADDS